MEEKLVRLLAEKGIKMSKKEAKKILKLTVFDDETYGTDPIYRSVSKGGKTVHIRIEHSSERILDVELAEREA